MRLFDFLKGNKEKNERPEAHPASVANADAKANNNAPFTKQEFQRAIKTIATMSYLFRDSTTLRSTGGGRNERMMGCLHSYAGMLGYLYEYTYHYGSYAEIADQKMQEHYILVAVAMDDVYNRNQSIRQLADNWSDVLQSVIYLQIDGTSEGIQMKALQPEIDFVTNVMETLSGGKCREPQLNNPEIMRRVVRNRAGRYN